MMYIFLIIFLIYSRTNDPQYIPIFSSSYNTLPTYSSNEISSRKYSTFFTIGNTFYLYGGYGKDESGTEKHLSDLWQLDLDTDTWSVIKGCEGSNCDHNIVHNGEGNYASDNSPGGRIGGVMFKGQDEGGQNSIYLMGGFGYMENLQSGTISHDSVFRFRKDINQWGKIRGLTDFWANRRVPGNNLKSSCCLTGIPHSHNAPGARAGSAIFLADTDKNLIFGGRRKNRQSYNDIWEYRISDDRWNYWKAIEGTCNIGNHFGMRSFNESNEPSSRSFMSYWQFTPSGEDHPRFYIFGGVNDCELESKFSDLWRYDFDINQWMWVLGSENHPFYSDIQGEFKYPGVYHKDNTIGGRSGSFNTKIQIDANNYILIVFFGNGLSESGSIGLLSDMWGYHLNILDPTVGYWSVIGDERDVAKIGTSNFPSSREGGFQYEHNGNYYFLSGEAQKDEYSIETIWDKWSFTFNVTCDNDLISYNPTVCFGNGGCVVNGTNGLGYKCACTDEYFGDVCSFPKHKCKGIVFDLDGACDNKGNCDSWDVCTCTAYQTFGQFCEEFISKKGAYIRSNISNEESLKIEYHIPVEYVTNTEIFNEDGETPCENIVQNDDKLGNFSVCRFDVHSLIASLTGYTNNLQVILGNNYELRNYNSIFLKVISNNASKIEYVNVTMYGVPNPFQFNGGGGGDDGLKVFIPIFFSLFGLLCCCIIIVIVIIVIIFVFYKKRRQRQRKLEELKHIDLLMHEKDMDEGKKIAGLTIDRKLFNVKFEEIEVDEVIAKAGSYATIFKAYYKGEIVCFKCYKTKDIDSQDHLTDFEKEVRIMNQLDHPNIVRYIGCTLRPPRIGVLMEFCENGDLRNYIQRSEYFLPIQEKLRVLSEIAEAMLYLKNRSILHRDLKSDNVLLNDELQSKLIDFGLSRTVESGNMNLYLTKMAGTSQYMAPEVTLSSKYGSKCDVFSFSIMLYELLTENFHPYGKQPEFNVELRVALNPDCRPSVDIDIFKEKSFEWYLTLMENCWAPSPEDRNNWDEIVEIFKENIPEVIEEMKTRNLEKRIIKNRVNVEMDNDVDSDDDEKKKKRQRKYIDDDELIVDKIEIDDDDDDDYDSDGDLIKTDKSQKEEVPDALNEIEDDENEISDDEKKIDLLEIDDDYSDDEEEKEKEERKGNVEDDILEIDDDSDEEEEKEVKKPVKKKSNKPSKLIEIDSDEEDNDDKLEPIEEINEFTDSSDDDL